LSSALPARTAVALTHPTGNAAEPGVAARAGLAPTDAAETSSTGSANGAPRTAVARAHPTGSSTAGSSTATDPNAAGEAGVAHANADDAGRPRVARADASETSSATGAAGAAGAADAGDDARAPVAHADTGDPGAASAAGATRVRLQRAATAIRYGAADTGKQTQSEEQIAHRRRFHGQDALQQPIPLAGRGLLPACTRKCPQDRDFWIMEQPSC